MITTATKQIVSTRKRKEPIKRGSSQYLGDQEDEHIIKFTPDPWLESRLDRTLKHYQRQRFSYHPTEYEIYRQDRVELGSLNLQEMYGMDVINYSLTNISRVIIPKGSFEDSEGNIDPKRITALVFTVHCRIANPDDVRLGLPKEKSRMDNTAVQGAADIDFAHIGRYKGIIPEYRRDRNTGKIIDAKIKSYIDRYYIPDTPANIKRVIKLYGEPRPGHGYVVRRASNPSISWRVPNFNEFVNEDPEVLIGARMKNLLHDQEGGVQNYKRWVKVEDDLIKTGKSTKSELDKISKEDIVNLLHEKQKKVEDVIR